MGERDLDAENTILVTALLDAAARVDIETGLRDSAHRGAAWWKRRAEELEAKLASAERRAELLADAADLLDEKRTADVNAWAVGAQQVVDLFDPLKVPANDPSYAVLVATAAREAHLAVRAERDRLRCELHNYEHNHGARCDAEQERLATIAESACRMLGEVQDRLERASRCEGLSPSRELDGIAADILTFLSLPCHEVPGLRAKLAARDRALDACAARIAELLAARDVERDRKRGWMHLANRLWGDRAAREQEVLAANEDIADMCHMLEHFCPTDVVEVEVIVGEEPSVGTRQGLSESWITEGA